MLSSDVPRWYKNIWFCPHYLWQISCYASKNTTGSFHGLLKNSSLHQHKHDFKNPINSLKIYSLCPNTSRFVATNMAGKYLHVSYKTLGSVAGNVLMSHQKDPVHSPQTWQEMSRSLVKSCSSLVPRTHLQISTITIIRNTWICYHKNGRKSSDLSGSGPTNAAGNVLMSHRKTFFTADTNTAGRVRCLLLNRFIATNMDLKVWSSC